VGVKTAVLAGLAVSLLMAGQPLAQQGYVGVYTHDVTVVGEALGLGAAGREGGEDIHLGYRTAAIEGLPWLGHPQAQAVLSINTHRTSDFVSAGLGWPMPLGGRFYVRPAFSLAYTDGKAGLPPANAPNLTADERARRTALYYSRIDFGSKWLFSPEVAVGMKFNPRLAGELSYVHLSNGQIFHHGKNQGLDDAGVRLVYSF
jgi:lipid A 3-O-deacylase